MRVRPNIFFFQIKLGNKKERPAEKEGGHVEGERKERSRKEERKSMKGKRKKGERKKSPCGSRVAL